MWSLNYFFVGLIPQQCDFFAGFISQQRYWFQRWLQRSQIFGLTVLSLTACMAVPELPPNQIPPASPSLFSPHRISGRFVLRPAKPLQKIAAGQPIRQVNFDLIRPEKNQVRIDFLGPLGIVLARLSWTPQQIRYREIGQEEKSAPDINTLLAQGWQNSLGLDYPLPALFDWLIGEGETLDGESFEVKADNRWIEAKNGWRLHYQQWSQYPRRVWLINKEQPRLLGQIQINEFESIAP